MHTPVSKKKGHLYLNTSLVAFGKKITYKATFLFAFVLCMSMNAGAQKTSVKQAGKNIPAWDTFSGNTYVFTKGPQLYSYSAQDANEPIAGLTVTISGTTSTCLSNGTITAQVTGSSGTVQYTLLDGTGATVKPPQNDNNVFTGLAAGTYQVSVSDAASTNVLSNKITLTTSYQALALTTTGVAPMPQYQVYSCTPSTTEGYLYVYIQSGTGNGPYKVTLYNGTGTMLSDTLVIPAGTYFGIINNLPNGNYKVGVTDACNSTVQSGTVTISNATTISYPAPITNLIYGTPNYTKSSVVGCGMGFDFYTAFFNSYFTYKDTIFTFIEFPAGNYSDTSYRNGPNMHLKFPTALAPAAINGQAYILWIKDPCSKKWYSTSYKFPDGSLSLSTYTSTGASTNNCDSIIPYISVQWATAASSSNNYCYDVKIKVFKNDAPGVSLKDTTLISGQTLNLYTFYHPTSSGDYTVTLTDANNNTETKVITITAQAPQKLRFGSAANYADCSLSSMVYQPQAYGFLANTTYPVTVRLLNTVAVPNAETVYNPQLIQSPPATSSTWVDLFGNILVPFTNPTYGQPNYYDTIKYEVSWPGCSRIDTAVVTFTAPKYKYKSAKFTGSTVTIGSGGCSANAANVTVNWETRDTTGTVVTSYNDFYIRQLPTGAYTTNASGTYTFNNLAPGTYQFGISPNKYPISGTWNIGYSIPATCAYWDTITVVVPKLNAPSVDVSKTYGIICAGQPANSGTLTIAAVGYGPFRYAIGPKGAGTFGTNQTSNVFSNLTAGDYDIRLTDTCGSQVVQTVQVVNASDLAKIKISSVNNSLVGCSNDNVTLQLNVVGTVSNIIWTLPDNSTVKDVTSLSIPNFSAANTGTYSVSVQSAAGCPASANINMTLAQSFNLQVTSPAAICKGSTVDLTTSAITAGSSNITTWAAYTNATATTAVTSPATTAPTTTTTYYIKGLSPDACVAIKPITVTVNDKASLGTLAKPAAICSGTALALTAPTVTTNGSPLNGSGKWYLNNVEFDPATLVSTADNNKTLYYSVVTDCGTTQTNSVTITVNAANSFTLQTATGTDNQSMCTGAAFTTTKFQLAGTATGVSMTGTFPTGVSGSYSGGVYTISGTPTSVGTYNYTLTSTGGTCAPATVSGTIKVSGTPSIATITLPPTVCAGNPLALVDPVITANGATVTDPHWELGTGTTRIDASTLMTYANNGQSLRYVITSTCDGPTITRTVGNITVKDKPVITITQPAAVCAGGTLSLPTPSITANGSSYTNAHWELDGVTVTSPVTVTTLNDGKMLAYVVTADCGGTVSSNLVPVKVNPIPTVDDISNSVVCNTTVTTPINFTGTVSGATYTWTNSNAAIGLAVSGTGNVPSFTAVNSGSTAVTATITVTPSANTCSGTAKTFTITVNPTPTVSGYMDLIPCAGNSIFPIGFIGSVSGTTFAWSNDNTSIGLPASGVNNIPSVIAVNNGTSPVVATITVTPSANTCDGTSKTFTITVNPTPTVNDISNSVVCNNTVTSAIGFSGTVSGTTYTWTNNNTAIGLAASGTGNVPSFTATNTGSTAATATITVTPSANTCGGTSKTFTITVNPTPAVNTIANSVVCNNTTTTPISFSGTVSGTTYTWTNSNASIGLASNGSGDIPSFTAVNSGSAAVTATITVTPGVNTCGGTSKTFTITVKPIPTVNTITDKVICNNTATTKISFSGNVSGATYAWTNSNPAIGLAASGTGDIPSFTATNTGSTAATATITVTPSANTCDGAAKTFTITVSPTPTINTVTNKVVCNNAATTAISFSGNVSNATYTWTNDNTAIGLAASGAGDIPSFTAVNSGSTAAIATITVTPSANTCDGTSKSFTMTVNPTPTVNTITNKVVCNNATTTAIGFSSNVSSATYTWANSNPAIGLAASGAGDIPSFTAANSGSTAVIATITVTPSANTCGGVSKTFTITVNPTPVVNDISNSVVCNNAATTAINFSSNVIGATYTWTNSNAAIGLAASGAGDIPSFAAANSGSTAVTATITVTPSANACGGASKTFTITVNPTPVVNDINNSVVCNNATATAIGFSSNVSGATYTWTNSNAAIGLAASGAGDIPSFTAVNSSSTPATATITVTPSANTCDGASKTFTIKVNPTPTVNAITNSVVCNNTATSAISFGSNVIGATYTWANNNPAIGLAASGAGDIPSFTAVNSGSTAATATITVTPSANTCAGTSKTFTITVNPTPIVNTIADKVVCNNAATSAISFGGNVSSATYTWTNSNPAIGLAASGAGDIPSFTAVNSGSTAVTATITVTPSANTCAGTSKTFTITVNPTPTVNTITDKVACNNAATSAISFGGNVSSATYTWTNNNTSIGLAASGTGDIASFTAVNTGSTATTAIITVTPSANTCAGTSKTFTITVNPTPTVNTINNQAICNGAVTTRVSFDGAVANTTYSWANSNTTIGLPASGTGDIASFTAVNTGSTLATATITVTPGANTCNGTSQSFTITVNPDAHLMLLTGNSSQVVNINTPLANVGYTVVNEKNVVVIGLPAGVTYSYTAGTVVISGTPTASGTFNYTVTATGDCAKAELTGTIIVNPDSDIKLISVNGTDGQTLCINKPLITIQYQVDNATNIIVTGLPTGVTYGINGGTVTITGTPTVSGTFNYQIVATGLAQSATRNGSITVNPDLTLTHGTGSESQVVCINKNIAAITYNVTNATDVTVSGLPSGVNYAVNAGVVTISGTPSKAGTFSYTVSATGICNSPLSLTGTITVNPDATIALVSGNNNQTLCINNNIAAITYTATNATAVTISGLPAGVSGSYDPASGSFTISGASTASGTFTYTVTATGSCTPASLNGTITASPDVKLTLAAGNNDQTVNINNPIANINYTIANETNTVVTGLPAGVTYNYTAGTVVISGTPTESGTFNYTITATGACKSAMLMGTIIVNPDSDIKLISVNGTDGQTLCINKPLITIQYQVDNATNITVTGLPANVTYGINGGTVTITGTPTVSGTFNYQIVATGLAQSATRDGSITVNPDVTLTHGTGSENQGVCINKAIASITYTVVNATDIKINGLPVGVNSSYDPASGSFTISGTPTQSGTYNYTVTAGGLCLPAQLTGKIVVTPDATIALVSGNNNQTLCVNNNITAITYNATNATSVTVSGLPTGVSGNYDPASGSFAISGVPTQSGTFNYIVTAIGTCQPANINGVITVNANDTLILSSGTANQTLCSNNAITTITYKALHVKNVTVTGLPAGVAAMYDIASGTVTISGSPTEIGVFNYTVQTTQSGCVSAQPMSGTITVKGKPVVAVIVTPAPVCAGSTLNLVTPNVSDNGDAITTAGWLLNDVAFNAATPLADTDNGQNLVYVATNTCGTTTSNIVQITVNKKPVVTTTSMGAVCAPNTIDLRSGISNYDANNYSYTFTDATGIVVANPAAVSVAGTYTVVAENKTSYCGSASQTLQVKINPKPVVNVVTFTPGEVCAPSTVNIQSLITNYDATTYNYSYTDQYGNAVATPTAISASGNYSITATDKVNDTHCSSQPVTVVVTVNPQPVITVVNNGNMALCGNTGTVDLTTGISNYNAGYTYTYTDAGGNPLSNVSAIGIPGTYYVTAKDNKCSSVKTAITLTRYATPVVTITDPAAVYDPYTVDITAAAVTAGSTADLTYAYYNSSNVLITTADAQKISGPGSYTYYLQGTSAQGCKSNTAPVHVLIKDRPVLSISSAEIWEGQKATLTLSLPTDVILPDAITVALNTRYPGSTIVKGDYDKPDKVIVPANTNSVTFVVNTWDNNVLDLDRILILEGGNTIYNVTPGTVLIHDSTSLKPQNLIITIGRDTIYGRGTGAVSVSLPIGISTSYPIPVSAYPASGTTINSTDYTMDNSVTIQPGNGSAILGVTVTNTAPEDRKLNLSGQSTGFVVKDGGVYIRQSRINVVPLVSDNGDGINDYLKIEGIEKYTSKMGGSNKVVLFNRWEDVIYEAGNYDNSAIKFDGRGNKHGAGRVPDGVYFYAITITIPDNELGAGESKTQTFKGYFRLQK